VCRTDEWVVCVSADDDLWAPVFAAFVAYAVIILINPLVNPRNSSLNEWFIFLLLGIVPAFLLWLARPGDFVGPSTDS
jgi:hypothetical protein